MYLSKMAPLISLLLMIVLRYIAVDGDKIESHSIDVAAPQRRTECGNGKDNDAEICNIYCGPLRCQNEYIASSGSTTTINVYCEEEYSCIGKIGINGYKNEKTEKMSSTLSCGDDDNSCLGGLFQFANLKEAVLENNVRDSDVVFKNVKSVQIEDNFRNPEEQGGVQKMKMYQNNFYTDNVRKFVLRTYSPYSFSGCTFNLGGLLPYNEQEKQVRFYCYAEGSCSGSIILLKRCGSPVEISCGFDGNCQSLMVIATKADCELSDQRSVNFIGDISGILMFCEGCQNPNRVFIQGTLAGKTGQPKALVHTNWANFKVAIEKHLMELKSSKEAKSWQESKVERKLESLTKVDNLGLYAGISLEIAMNAMSVANEIATASILGGALAVADIFPATAIIALPLTITLGQKYHQKMKQRKHEKIFQVDQNSIAMIQKSDARETDENLYSYDVNGFVDEEAVQRESYLDTIEIKMVVIGFMFVLLTTMSLAFCFGILSGYVAKKKAVESDICSAAYIIPL